PRRSPGSRPGRARAAQLPAACSVVRTPPKAAPAGSRRYRAAFGVPQTARREARVNQNYVMTLDIELERDPDALVTVETARQVGVGPVLRHDEDGVVFEHEETLGDLVVTQVTAFAWTAVQRLSVDVRVECEEHHDERVHREATAHLN